MIAYLIVVAALVCFAVHIYQKDLAKTVVAVETNIFDQCTRYTNCIVEVLTNSVNGEISVGWYPTTETQVNQQ